MLQFGDIFTKLSFIQINSFCNSLKVLLRCPSFFEWAEMARGYGFVSKSNNICKEVKEWQKFAR